MVPEAELQQTDAGLVPASPGWFVMNARDARWFEKPGQGFSLPLTGDDEYEAETFFPMLGMAIRVVKPGEPTGTYHWETEQEDFLVLAGEGILLVEGEERPLRQWDFVHCPPETRHAFVGAGDGPCVLLCASSRQFQKDGPWGLLLRRRDGGPLQRELARGHAGRERRVRAVPAAARHAVPARPAARVSRRLAESYEEFPRIEEAFRAALDESLRPRSPELLYELVERLGLPERSVVVDVGCGDGRHSHRLAERFGFFVVGIDPVAAPAATRQVRFVRGAAEALPLEDESADLVWCRDVLVHVADLDRAYAEFRRVLRDGGHGLVFQTFATERLEPREAEWLWRALGVEAGSTDPACNEAAIAAAGLRVDERIDLGSEWGEWSEERSGTVGRKLLHAARLLRDPERYRARFGEAAYEIMLGDCLWHVYAMIGKLERRVYLLTKL